MGAVSMAVPSPDPPRGERPQHGRLARELKMPDSPTNPDPASQQQQPLADLKEDGRANRKFLIGLLVGIAGTGFAFVFIRIFLMQRGGGEWIFAKYHPAILLLPILGLVKIAVGTGLLFAPTWKSFGKGLLASVPIGLIVFFGMCAADSSH